MYSKSFRPEGDGTQIEVVCPRCKGTCEDRHGDDCLACDGLGSVLFD